MNKRGQITIFIILAVIIIAAVALYFTFRDTIVTEAYSPEVSSVKTFVEECIKDTGRDAIYYIGQNGGYFIPPARSTDDGIPYYYYEGRSYMPSKEKIGEETSLYVDNLLFFCTQNFIDFPTLDVKQEEIKTRTRIEDEEIIFNVNYPLAINNGESTTIIRDFENIKIPIRFGVIYNVVDKMIQDQLEDENICLTCILNAALENNLYVDMYPYDNTTITFEIEDRIYDPPLIYKFSNKYS